MPHPPKIYTEAQFSNFRKKKIQTLQERFATNQTINMVPPDAGVYHTEVPEPIINFIDTDSQYKLEKNNAYIVLGRDRPSDETSGYGAPGAQRASSIDMVVGRMASYNDGLGPVDGASVHNHYGCDAARIVLSQTTDIDTNFGLCDGNLGNIKGRSGIGIKADSVRIIGREGVKIVTGAGAFPNFGFSGEPNSRGGKLVPAPKIELIAGNSNEPLPIAGGLLGPYAMDIVAGLQPVVLGENTRSALTELAKIVDEIWSALFNMALVQNAFNGVMAVDVVQPQGGLKAAATPVAAVQVIEKVMLSLWQTRINKLLWEVNFLEEYGYRFICSRNVSTT